MIKVIYNKVCGRCVQREPLTSGMVGQTIHFEYSHDFDGLAVTAVFTDGTNTINVVNPGNECIIPREILTTVGAMVKVGIYAVRGDELVIPTIYAHIGVVLKGADPSGDISIDPTLPIWAQTQALIGNLSELETQAKDNLVVAVNEVKQTADTKANAADLAPVATSGSYNDLSDKPTIPSVPTATIEANAAARHTHNNKTLLDSITEALKTAWNTASEWVITNGANVLSHLSDSIKHITADERTKWDGKQDKLIAGDNITIAADGKTISATGGGGSVPKPLTYDYMPEGYPTKSVQTTTLMEEQELEFALSNGVYMASITNEFEIVEGQTYTVNWDGTEYECVRVDFNSFPFLGNLSILGVGDDTGEPFVYSYIKNIPTGQFGTFDTSASHTISVKTIAETVTPIDEKYLPTIPADKLPTIPADKLPNIPADKLPNIPADKLPNIPADKLPTIPVIEFTTKISESIANYAQPSFIVSNLSYSEIYALVEKGNFQIKDSVGANYRPIRTEIGSSGSIFVDILVIGTPTTYAQLACNADQTMFYRNSWWQIEATKK